MSSLAGILSIARTAMQAQQVAMQTTSHNIANANVVGYSAQTVRFAANTPETLSYGSIGTGVVVQGITRSRDALLDAQTRAATSDASGSSATSVMLGRVESVLGEPSATGLSSAMDALWNSWSDLASDPSSSVARSAVGARGTALATMFNQSARQLDDVSASARTGLDADVSKVNSLLTRIGQLNPAITSGEADHRSANDLRDERDRALDQLSSLIGSQVVEHSDGSVAVYASGHLLVDRDNVHQLTTAGTSVAAVTIVGDTSPLPNSGGSIGANLDAINTRIPNVMNALDALAGSIVREVNAIHTSGLAYSGTPPVSRAGGNFFTQNGAAGTGDLAQTAHGMSLDASLSNLTNIVASGGTSTGPGDNTVANQLAGLRDAIVTVYDASGAAITSTSLGSFHRQIVTNLGLETSQINDLSTAQDAVVRQSQSRRESVSGVATDEELVNLIKQQQAYAAAARIISVVDEMSKTLLAIGT
ncbi:MAG: flagellar hook-associated protein FlgK [bacterium]